jgi:hypothetical protein
VSISLAQILALVGKLDDTPGDDTPRARFRRYLAENVKEVGELRDYVGECLSKPDEAHYRALQDLVNHIGSFLGFDVQFGRYQGVSNQIGFDGHWISPKPFHLVVEVKTNDHFPVKTNTLLNYVNELISEKRIPNWASALGLYVVGKPHPELKQLDHAIIGEKQTDHLRIVTVESLLNLAEMASQYDVSHDAILSLLLPSGPRIDPIINLITGLLAAQIAETGAAPVKPPALEEAAPPPAIVPKPAKPLPLLAEVGGGGNDSKGEVTHWLTPVKTDEQETAEECVRRLVGKEHLYAFGERTPGRKLIKVGDWICFYATTKGVVAHARVASHPTHAPNPKIKHPEQFPWVFSVDSVKLYTERPVVVDGELRSRLDAFKGKDLYASWAWFVQATHRISERDFRLLTLDTALSA